MHYKLVGHEPVLCEDVLEWQAWLATADRKVALTEVGPFVVSTVFLPIGVEAMFRRPPRLFETIVFRDGSPDEVTRTETWAEAEALHASMVAKCKGKVN
jgi:hypothetical protein